MPEAAATSGSPCLKNKVIGCKNELKANGNQKERAVCNACFQCFRSHSKAPLYTSEFLLCGYHAGQAHSQKRLPLAITTACLPQTAQEGAAQWAWSVPAVAAPWWWVVTQNTEPCVWHHLQWNTCLQTHFCQIKVCAWRQFRYYIKNNLFEWSKLFNQVLTTFTAHFCLVLECCQSTSDVQ